MCNGNLKNLIKVIYYYYYYYYYPFVQTGAQLRI